MAVRAPPSCVLQGVRIAPTPKLAKHDVQRNWSWVAVLDVKRCRCEPRWMSDSVTCVNLDGAEVDRLQVED